MVKVRNSPKSARGLTAITGVKTVLGGKNSPPPPMHTQYMHAHITLASEGKKPSNFSLSCQPKHVPVREIAMNYVLFRAIGSSPK